MQVALLGGPLFFRTSQLWLGCRAAGESVLEVHVWMMFRYVVPAGPLWGERFGEVFVCWGGCCVDSWLGCRATGESVLEVYFWMAFGKAEVISPLWAPR